MSSLLSSESSSTTWQKRILPYMSHQQQSSSISSDDNDGHSSSFAYEYDNTSQSPQHYCDFAHDDDYYYYCNNDDHGVMMTALRWTRILILKVGRMYYGAPLCLVLFPLLVGLVVGYGFGRIKQQPQAQSSKNNNNKEEEEESTKNNKIWSFFAVFDNIFSKISVFFLPYHIMPSLLLFVTGTQQQQQQQNNNSILPSKEKENRMRHELLSNEQHTISNNKKKNKTANTTTSTTPQHIAVIMDGNRRYGRETYPENPLQGHVDGSQTLLKFVEWCLEDENAITMLTVYAFSTENWNRPPQEVAALMSILQTYSDELRMEALKRRIRIRVHSTDQRRIPKHVQSGLDRMVHETAQFEDSPSLIMNICLSYGGRDELVQACRKVVMANSSSSKSKSSDTIITEESFQQALLIPYNPDIVIRTSGEVRLSNFLLWQTAYSEWFFLDKHWPSLEKEDFLQVLDEYAHKRKRRFGT